MLLSLPEWRGLRGADFRGGTSGGEGFADGVEVGLVDVGGKLVEEAVKFGGDVRGEAAGEFDVVEDGAELLLVALDGAHGMEEDVDAVGDLQVLLVGGFARSFVRGFACGLVRCFAYALFTCCFSGAVAPWCFGLHSWPFQ